MELRPCVNQFFCHCGKISEKIDKKETRFVLVHGSETLSTVGCLCYFWTMVRQNIMTEEHGRAQLLTLCCPGSRERERVRAQGSDTPFKDATSDLLPPIRPHFLTAHSAMNSSMDLFVD
jgi:hypothetical protein